MNTKGRIKLAAAISPNGSVLSVNYICFGNDSYKTIIASQGSTNKTWTNTYDQNWKGWYSDSDQITDLIKVNEKSINVEISENASALISCSAPSTGYKLVGFAMKSVTSWYPSNCVVWNDTQIAIFNLDNTARAFVATARCFWMKL